MDNRKTNILLTIGHLLFWVVVSWCFCAFSHLRPLAIHYWKELLCVVFVAAMTYTSFFVLIPKVLYKRHHLQFWIYTLLLLAATVFAEMWLVDSDMHIRAVWLSPNQFRLYYENTIFLLFLRDATFFLFFLLLKLYRTHAIALENIERMISHETHQFILFSSNTKPQLVDLNDIALFTYQNNGIIITLKSGLFRKQNGSLVEVEGLLPSDCFIRANRQTLVMLNSIAYYTPFAVYVKVNTFEVAVRYYSTKSDKLLRRLMKWDFSKYKQEDFVETDDDYKQKLPDHMQKILDYLQKNPDASSQQVADALHISTRTAQRQILELRKIGKLAIKE